MRPASSPATSSNCSTASAATRSRPSTTRNATRSSAPSGIKTPKTNAETLAKDFSAWLQAHKDQLAALTIFYDQPFRRREITFAMLEDVMAKLSRRRPALRPAARLAGLPPLEELQGQTAAQRTDRPGRPHPPRLRHRRQPRAFADTVRKNFQNWIMARHAGAGAKFTEEQMAWLRMIRDHIITSFHLERDDLDMAPFDAWAASAKCTNSSANAPTP